MHELIDLLFFRISSSLSLTTSGSMVGVVVLLLGLLLVLRFRLGLGDDTAAKQTEARCRQTDSCAGRKRESRSIQVCGVEGIADFRRTCCVGRLNLSKKFEPICTAASSLGWWNARYRDQGATSFAVKVTQHGKSRIENKLSTAIAD